MKKIILMLGILTLTSLMACDVCVTIDSAKAKVEYTYKLWKIEVAQHGYHTNKAKELKLANEKAYEELDSARSLSTNHKGK